MAGFRPKIETLNLQAYFGKNRVLKGINLSIPEKKITAIMGPSGCGKTTFVRCLNRLHELNPEAKVEGKVLLDGIDIYSPDIEPIEVRRKIGMVFQIPNPFPTMSIYDNVVAGLKLNGIKDKRILDEVVERSLVMASLWDEVKNKLKASPSTLSGGQQQRLCIARALAVQPEVLLMDEPTSNLDPIATGKIEQTMLSLKNNYTIVLVTHNIQQVARIADYVAFFYMGELIEYGETKQIFEDPRQELTKKYVTGKFG